MNCFMLEVLTFRVLGTKHQNLQSAEETFFCENPVTRSLRSVYCVVVEMHLTPEHKCCSTAKSLESALRITVIS